MQYSKRPAATELFLESGVDYDARRIFLFGEINPETACGVIIALRALESRDDEITIVMNSEGGEEASGYAIFDAIRLSRCKITIQVYGEASSMGAVILQAADHRAMTPEAQYLIHNGTVPINRPDAEGDISADELLDRGREVRRSNRHYHDLIAQRTQIPIEKIRKWCREEKIFYAEEALRLGFIDEILKPGKKETWTIKPSKKR